LKHKKQIFLPNQKIQNMSDTNWAAKDENSDVVLKILLIGDSGAGKSSILLRFTGFQLKFMTF